MVCWPDVAFLTAESQLGAAVLARSDVAPVQFDLEPTW